VPAKSFLLRVFLALVLLVGIVWLFIPEPPPIQILSMEEGAKALKPSLFESMLQKTGLFRTRQSVLLQGTLMEIEERAAAQLMDKVLLQPPLLATNGTQIWILNDSDLLALGKSLREISTNDIISSPRIQTGSGSPGSIFVGNTLLIQGVPTSVGIGIDLLPRVHHDHVDLTTMLKMTEAITISLPTSSLSGSASNTLCVKTNLALAGRFQIPTRTGVFLLKEDRTATDQKRFGFILSVKLLDNKGK
jgi:hypothetical protein